jgi:hypothetical protein
MVVAVGGDGGRELRKRRGKRGHLDHLAARRPEALPFAHVVHVVSADRDELAGIWHRWTVPDSSKANPFDVELICRERLRDARCKRLALRGNPRQDVSRIGRLRSRSPAVSGCHERGGQIDNLVIRVEERSAPFPLACLSVGSKSHRVSGRRDP